jgi:DNA (cytosine-5)-methyltransferase 1
MKYLSTFSGIEAATVAWHPLGWQPVGFSEIEPFPCAVLKHHYPQTPNYGDITQFRTWSVEPFQLLVGGSPCQSFSVAGLRKGLADERGNLMLEFGRLAEHYRPTWVVWENVPGVLSSNGGRDFASFLTMLAEFGYGFAYRVLDAQYFGVPQRRRRVFVVGCLGDWRPAAAVLFDPFSMSGHPTPSRKARQGTAGAITGGVELCGPLNARDYKDPGTDGMNKVSAKMVPVTYDMQQVTAPVNKQSRKSGDPCHTLSSDNAGNAALVQPMAFDTYNYTVNDETTQTVRRGTDNEHIGCVLQPIPLNTMTIMGRPSDDGRMGSGIGEPGDPAPTLTKGHSHAVAQPMAFGVGESSDVGHCIRANSSKADKHDSTTYVAQPFQQIADCLTAAYGTKWNGNASATNGSLFAAHQMSVRRLTPTECERLQGFPDGYTAIPWKNKPADQCPDGPRYKALGNSMAVPVMRWIGERIQAVEDMMKELKK